MTSTLPYATSSRERSTSGCVMRRAVLCGAFQGDECANRGAVEGEEEEEEEAAVAEIGVAAAATTVGFKGGDGPAPPPPPPPLKLPALYTNIVLPLRGGGRDDTPTYW